MQRSTFVLAGLAAFGLILATFVVRGTTRLVLGERISLLLALPLAVASLVLVLVLLSSAVLDQLGVRPMEDDLSDGSNESGRAP